MFKVCIRLALSLGLLLCASLPALAQTKIALVIGNAAYRSHGSTAGEARAEAEA